MQFDSLAAALQMSGHGAYVWPVYLLAALVCTLLLAGPAWRNRSIMAEQRGRRRREQARNARGGDHAPGS